MGNEKNVGQTLNDIEKKLKNTNKHNKNESTKQVTNDLKYKIIDLEKENEMIQNHLEEITVTLNTQANNRKNMMKEVNQNIDLYSSKLVEYENKINQYEIQEIKYKNQERELEEYIEMYNNKCLEYNEEIEKLNREIITLRKKSRLSESTLSGLRAVVTSMIGKYGIEDISNTVGIEVDNIEKYLQE